MPKKAAKEKITLKSTPHHTLLSLEISGGFLRGTKIEFADGLNCIIGGRGTGKTTVLEFLRFALGLMPEPRLEPARAKALEKLIRANLDSGMVRLRVRTKHGIEYITERSYDGSIQVLNEQGTAVPVSLDRDLIFTADVYSQNEIEEIATNSSLQLSLLDKFIEKEVTQIAHELAKISRQLDQNAADLLRLDREIEDVEAAASEGPSIAEKLKGLIAEEGPDAALLNQAHSQKALRAREMQTIVHLQVVVEKLGADVPNLLLAFERSTEGFLEREIMDGPNANTFSTVAKHLNEFIVRLQSHRGAIEKDVAETVRQFHHLNDELSKSHCVQDDKYRQLVNESEELDGKAVERTALQKRQAIVAAAERDLQAKRRQRDECITVRENLMRQLSELRDQRFAARKQIVKRLNSELDGTVRVTIVQSGDRQRYKSALADALKGASVKQGMVADRIVQSMSPSELAAIVNRQRPEEIANRSGLDSSRSRIVADMLRQNGAVYSIESVELDDSPRIELKDGAEYKDSAQVSTGQRCTAILPILLLQSERPLLIDQPEDNLDNSFIYDNVVRRIHEAKGARQIIFVTHNPNIPVLGDAERIFVLSSNGKQGTVSHAGNVDELKEQIEAILEGGEEAFLRRKERYGH